MNRSMGFWDASALTLLCVHQNASAQAHAYLRKLSPVVWWGSIVEIHSAISRLTRTGELTSIDLTNSGALIE